MGISAVIISFNEESKIGNCIRSLTFADEVVVVDSRSTDRTRDIARELGAIVIERDWPGFAEQKQFATNAAKNDHIFNIDADEIVSIELAEEVASQDLSAADAFRMPRLSHYLGRPIKHGSWYPDKQIRLFDRRKCHWNGGVIHESISVPSGRVLDMNSDLLHFSSEGIRHHAEMIIERYAPLGAEKLRIEGRKVGLGRLLLSGPAAFISGFIVKLGFLDGVRGLIIAVFAGFNAFLKYAIRYEQQVNGEPEASPPPSTTEGVHISS